MTDKPRRRRPEPKFPTQPKYIASTYAVVTKERGTASVINNALEVLAGQIDIIRVKAAHGELETEQVRNLRTYIQSLLELRKDEREQEKHDKVEEGLEGLTTQELIQMIEEKAPVPEVEAPKVQKKKPIPENS